MVVAHPAATVVLMTEIENGFKVLLVKRNEKLEFCGGAWVFPGGRVDAEDYQKTTSNDLNEIAKFAAVREVYEETGLNIQVDSLLFMEHFTTPAFSPKRFSTYFYITSVQESVVRVDGSEILDHKWIAPQDALAEHEEQTIYLPMPTMFILERIATYQDIDSVLKSAKNRELRYC